MTINISNEYIISVILLCIGGILWYFLYGLELFINGGISKSHFYYVYEELMWILPGGWKRKLKYCDNDVELAKSLPGISHFIFTHIIIPFGMFIFYYCLYLT